MLSTDYDHLQDEKQTLGEHLYGRVEEMCPQHASHITGILLEAGNQEVMRMLQNEALLRRRVEGAQRVLLGDGCAETKGACQHTRTHDKRDGVGEKLYLKVREMDARHCAKVTGMLLELDPDTITNLLESPQDLHRAVNKATSTLLTENPEESCEVEFDEEKQELGEELYSILEETHPELASKITGMLLEMEVVHIRELLDHPSKLNEKVQLALDALRRNAAVHQ